MAYTKTTWQDLPSTNTPITASNLNNIENQVDANTDDIADLQTDVATNTSNISTNTANIATNTTNIATNTSNLTPATWSSWSSNSTYIGATGATRCYKIGRIVILIVNISLSTATTANIELLYNLPLPYGYNVTAGLFGANGTGVRVRLIQTTGTLEIDGSSTSAQWYNGIITYVSAS